MVFDPRMPEREACVLGYQLERWAREKPDQTAIIFHGGETWTGGETLELVRRAAKGLQDMGVKKGEHVLSWQPNNREAVLTWFGLNYLGAVYVPINTAYKGNLLRHLVGALGRQPDRLSRRSGAASRQHRQGAAERRHHHGRRGGT